MLTTELTEWIRNNERHFGSPYESLFATTVFSLIPELRVEALGTQFAFLDSDGKQRYCDFVIQEGRSIRIAIEVDGFDKTGAGHGMSHDEFVQWQRRQASLTVQGWYVLRFANRDVQNEPERCAKDISQLLVRLRSLEREQSLEPMLASIIQNSSKQTFPDQIRKPSRVHSTQNAHHLAPPEQNVPLARAPTGARQIPNGQIPEKARTDVRKVVIFYASLLVVGFIIFSMWKSKDIYSNEASLHLPPEHSESNTSYSRVPPISNGEVGIGADRIEEVMDAGAVQAEINAARRRYELIHAATESGEASAVPVTEQRRTRASLATRSFGEVGIGADRIEEIMTGEEWLAEHFAARRRYAELQRNGLLRRTTGSVEAASRGSTCKYPINWRASGQHIGDIVAVEGPIVRVTHRDDVQGRPTWIELGRSYPNPVRLVLVAWGPDRSALPDHTMVGTTVCVTGKLGVYKGTPQIELTTPSQIHVVQ